MIGIIIGAIIILGYLIYMLIHTYLDKDNHKTIHAHYKNKDKNNEYK